MQYLIDTMEYQITHYYPRLRSIFMPRAAIKKYHFGERREIVPPQRWEEPLVQYFLKEFVKLMSLPDKKIGLNNEDIKSDPVYSGIINPDVRKAFLERRMTEKEYRYIERGLGQDHIFIADPSAGRSLEVRREEGKALVKASPQEIGRRRLDSLPSSLLAVEAGLTEKTVKKYRKGRLNGEEIVDAGFTIMDMSTTGMVIQNLRESGIPRDQWSDVIEVAREIRVPIILIIEVMKNIPTNDVSEVVGLVDELGTYVTEYAEEHRMRPERVWYNALGIYSGLGRGDVRRTGDILTGRFWSNVDEESFSMASKILEE